MDWTRTETSNWALLKRLLALGWLYKARCLGVVALQTLFMAVGVGGLALTGLAVDVIRFRHTPEEIAWPRLLPPPGDAYRLRVVAYLALGILGVAAVRAALNYTAVISSARLVQDIVIHLRSKLYRKLQELSFRFYDHHQSGSIINRVTADVQMVRMFVDGVVVQGLILLVSLALYLAYMLRINPLLTLACLAPAPLMWIITMIYARFVKPAMLEARARYDEVILTLAESVEAAPQIRGFAREELMQGRFDGDNRRFYDQQRRIFTATSLYSPTIGFLTNTSMMVLIGYGGYLVIRGELALGTGLLVFFGLLSQFTAQVNAISGLVGTVQQSLTAAQRVFEVLDMEVEIKPPERPVPLPHPRGAVEFRGVTFGYQPANPVLHDIGLNVKPGQVVAILGPTGAGKSTLLSLIPRFYDPQQGTVLLDGIDIRRLDLDELRNHIGFVFQESFLFSTTVRSNIAFGHPNATDDQIRWAAEIARANEFIEALPEGYDTVVGERGADLSGGQRQRIAIARALLHNPPVLLMDDPTAAIDPQTESEIHAAMENAMSSRTTFVVTHRLSTLRRADRVVVLERGRITATGTHRELVDQPGLYREIALHQLQEHAGEAPHG